MLTYKLPWHDLVHVFCTLSGTRIARFPFFWVRKDTQMLYYATICAMMGQLSQSVLYSRGFGNTIKSGISFPLHSPDLKLCNFIQSTEDDVRASTQNAVFSVPPAVQQAICVCNMWCIPVRPRIPFPVSCVSILCKNLISTTVHWNKTSAPQLH